MGCSLHAVSVNASLAKESVRAHVDDLSGFDKSSSADVSHECDFQLGIVLETPKDQHSCSVVLERDEAAD